MATAITRAFEHWQAQQILNNLPARPDTVIFAHIPGLDSNTEIDRDEGIPDAAFIVHSEAVAQYGVINDSAVAYSVVLDTRIGDFSFNWIGLVDSASNTLCMIVHNALQQKIATAGGVQGNNITRTFVMEFDGAAEASQITVTAQTWQIDFSARLSGIDEITRLANYDYYGHAAFFADGFSVTKEADKYRVNPGLAYIGGIRALLTDAVLLDASENNVIYADVSLQGSVLGQFNAIIHIGVKSNADDLTNYPDPNGFIHYVAPLALITASGEEDKREANPFDKAIADINAALKEHEKSRNHPDATLNDKGFTQLGNDIDSDSEKIAATLKAVKKAVNAGVTAMSDHVRDENPHGQYLQIEALLSEINALGPDAIASTLKNLELGPENFSGRLLNVRVFTSNGAYTKTKGVGDVEVEAIGGGGASGALSATGAGQNSVSCPGSVGAYAKVRFTNVPDSVPVTIGTGGVGVIGNGTMGGATSFGDLLLCPGGAGSQVANAIQPPGYTTATSGAARPIVAASGQLLVLSYGQQYNPAVLLALGVATNYVAQERSLLGNYGLGANGQLSGASQVQKIGVSGVNGVVIVREYAA
ncbi:TPA: phage tail protein [Yersinia enterocolitica]